eukprot:CAMPEP_0198118572 /NCGR_PEP_ID=MMETSP1442-20131203/22234_1 /TAXON_ID= /ORGANISM="Craspedostauros australis, Strain CCMP3328" /LENGTH=60 /DNA_ID=CAMNT_0043776853 /DNA_START=90 /DNA_END=272 /DNA_ORIENTATION=+
MIVRCVGNTHYTAAQKRQASQNYASRRDSTSSSSQLSSQSPSTPWWLGWSFTQGCINGGN